MSKLLWALKQLLPLTYRAEYEADDGLHFAVWRMWLGGVYQMDDYRVKED